MTAVCVYTAPWYWHRERMGGYGEKTVVSPVPWYPLVSLVPLVFLCGSVPHLFYPLICRWAFQLLPCPGCVKSVEVNVGV